MSWIFGIAIGLVTGFLANVLFERRRALMYHILPSRYAPTAFTSFDARVLGLYTINRWTTAKPLLEDRLRTHVTATPLPQTWLTETRLSELVKQHATDSNAMAPLCYLVDYDIDHGDAPNSEEFAVTLARTHMNEFRATCDLLKEDQDALGRIAGMLDAGRHKEFARSAPPSSIKICVSLVSATGKTLAIRRSSAVDNAGLWTLGPNESMVIEEARMASGREVENFFTLARRCLYEELGLRRTDYGPVSISWMGYYLPTTQVKIFAQTRLHLPERLVEERLRDAIGLYEADAFEWLPFDRPTILQLVENWEWSKECMGRIWSDSTPLAAHELWRMRFIA